ncbi:undecaprenyldiphospho-muramoylpentapeptide beta-N-acetylglucosaminyltransferase [Paenibacillus sp.]|jgi:UDP-N-acetylglucosamine--N-acetylmuramyl-(pentapeptide) pyrophosphoryl-undecaprenol N-acetylglucosamine transferase|uniref:undecaprenyldiphospho-muramoylpentapeptide beta-N-acetylglucosaminyltransferase n=1 Tax=Paenibacillus sp. TaxID=58172 RepID=UPI0028268CE9|nr:undecaprenyldiphospho-muramoylpentapeptide beta-N-acetylglucosaminyltransferase [Paenibacillus sp.]MDR0270251.1 undecaprenyldiphospho-muramoylpentapeptide beta-N-acetylglucosaminyltransferase [Paenibacillus sp.]
MNKVMFTGGGSAGHVTVNMALMPLFLEEGWSVDYVGSAGGIEKDLVSTLPEVKYFPISTGKLRRYLDIQNVKDPFKVVKGAFQAYTLIKQRKPQVVFSKGGFVSVPVVVGAWLNRVPVIIHESDITPGLANRISIPMASFVCTTFPETAEQINSAKSRYVGAVVRKELHQGSADRGRDFCGFQRNQFVLLIMGGSLGARKINEAVRSALPTLLNYFQVVHICGKGQIDPNINEPGYRQYEYINDELPDVLAMSDLVVSRAGSNSIFEFLSLQKPMLLIPLTRQQSRGDQILNAHSFEKAGYCKVLEEENLNEDSLVSSLMEVFKNRREMIENMKNNEHSDALSTVFDLIKETANHK